MPSNRGFAAALWMAGLLLLPGLARAHRDDYIGETIVYRTLARGELEGEYWLDFGRQPDAQHFFRYNASAEWGITGRLMAEGRLTFRSESEAGTVVDTAVLGTRYRLSDEGVLPIDIAGALELSSEREPGGDSPLALEPRLILSKNFAARVNLTANLSGELPFEEEDPAFLAALGARFNWYEHLRVASELQDNFRTHEAAVIPQVWLQFKRVVILKLGYAVGLLKERTDFARASLELEF